MERLTGLDAGFLYMETQSHPMHTLKLVVLEPSAPGEGGGLHDKLHAGLSARLHLLPPFRRRVLEVPLGLHHPLWIEDPRFDLAAHLRRVVVPAPGTSLEVDAVVADIASVPLDRGRPLWEMWTLEGLEGGRAAVLVKIHHAVADGVAVAGLLANVMTAEPSDLDPDTAPRWAPDRLPTSRELLRGALGDHLRQVARLPELVMRTRAGIEALLENRRRSTVRTPRPVLDTPHTSFNGPLTDRRSFATASLSLKDAKMVKTIFGVTLNDVVLCLVSGALRSYLDARGELPARSLVASVPTSSERRGGLPRLGGNHVSSLFTTLATDLPDSVDRLRAIHAVGAEAKAVEKSLGAELLEEWAAYAPPPLFGWVLRQWAERGMARYFPAAVNLIVSNVPGPTSPLFVPGHRLHAIYSVGPVLEGIGLNITTWSYLDELYVGVLGCRGMVPEPHRITDGMRTALSDLVGRASAARDVAEVAGVSA